MLRLATLASVIMFAVWVYTFLDVILTDASLVRNLPKLTWVMLLVFVFPVGMIGWFVAGRPVGATAAPGAAQARIARSAHPSRRPSNRPPPPLGPDDDPAFLRKLDEQLRKQPGDDDSSS